MQVKCQIKIIGFTSKIYMVRAKIHGQYLALGIPTMMSILFLSFLFQPLSKVMPLLLPVGLFETPLMNQSP